MKSTKRRRTALLARRFFLLLILAAAAIGLWAAGSITEAGRGPAWLRLLFAPEQSGVHVGLIVGHRGNDSGAVCPDGLTEAEVTSHIAELVAAGLNRQGISVDQLDEFDARLAGYQAAAVVSVHVDSCAVDMSGFKVAGSQRDGGASDRLAACLWDKYAQETGLPGSPDTITDDMVRYHAFGEVAPATPAAIIEVGFLGGDREFLTGHANRAAAGIVQGVTCFLAQP